ncbi:MAG: [FeFe] hydrogenase H-cluster maturation GTPase HydF [Lachnospiraceae bacterium]
MGMNQTPSSERVHIGIFGKTNAGKSSIINAITGQSLSIVSQVRGTTTDPVSKTMELLPLGPVVMIDTPGLDDDSELGKQRVEKSYQVLNKTDIAVVLIDGTAGADATEQALIEKINEKNMPHVVAINKSELLEEAQREALKKQFAGEKNLLFVSAYTGEHIWELKELLARLNGETENEKRIIGDLLQPKDTVILVVPIDSAAPKGRLILPQQQTIRDILEVGAISLVTRETELVDTLNSLKEKPKLVVTDSQAFHKVSADTPDDVLLTSFSILFARYKGTLRNQIQSVKTLDTIKDGDTILISEGCTHHRQCDDIGTVKLPRWIREYTKKDVQFAFTSGTEFPDDLSKFAMVVHCGACMLNEREMQYRAQHAKEQGVAMTNYGILIAYVNGILKRALQPFPEYLEMLEK